MYGGCCEGGKEVVPLFFAATRCTARRIRMWLTPSDRLQVLPLVAALKKCVPAKRQSSCFGPRTVVHTAARYWKRFFTRWYEITRSLMLRGAFYSLDKVASGWNCFSQLLPRSKSIIIFVQQNQPMRIAFWYILMFYAGLRQQLTFFSLLLQHKTFHV